MKEITDKELKNFIEWYKERFGKTYTYASSLTLSMAGNFHIAARMAEPLVKRLEGMGVIHIKNKHDVYFTETAEPDFRPHGVEW